MPMTPRTPTTAGRNDGPAAEVLGHLVVAEPPSVPHQIDRGKVRRRGYGHNAAKDGGRVDPAVHRISSLATSRYPARRDPTCHGSHAIGHQDRGEGEPGTEQPPMTQLHDRLPERETRAAQHDPEGCEVNGTKRVSVIDAYASGKDVHKITKMKINQTWLASHTGPMECSIVARGCAPRSGAAGSQVPESGAEVGTAEDRVRDNGQQQHHGDGRAHPTVSSAFAGSSVEASVSALGPYGVS